jgi:hypothetical protein
MLLARNVLKKLQLVVSVCESILKTLGGYKYENTCCLTSIISALDLSNNQIKFTFLARVENLSVGAATTDDAH